MVHQRADGHPLFMVTLVDHLAQRGWRGSVEGQRWVHAAIAEVEREVPDSLRQLIEQQVQALKDDDQRVLEAASVAGIEFSAATVAAGLDTGVAVAEARCAALVRGSSSC